MTRTEPEEASIRPGEQRLDAGPVLEPDARLCFIGRIRTPWGPGDCPRNISSARETGRGARIELAAGLAAGLRGLAVGQAMIVVYWMDRARRDLIVQAPRHVEAPRGTFALRSPHRPNPLAQSVARILAIDPEEGVLEVDALDCYDGTPLIDLKPWLPTIDAPPGDHSRSADRGRIESPG